MNSKDSLISHALSLIKDENYSEEAIKEFLELCWAHGACMAFFAPDFTEEELGDAEREACARFILNATVIARLKERLGELTQEEEEQAENFALALESRYPIARLDKDEPSSWIIGKRSQN
jgi:hypothetical protein